MKTFFADTTSQLLPAALEIIQHLTASRVVALYGPMGAGKTTLVKALCEVLDVKDVALSPTFSLINEYRTKAGESVYHFDFYRIIKQSEAFDMGCEEYFWSGCYCFVEWPEKIEGLLPPGHAIIRISVAENGERRTLILDIHKDN